MMSSLSESERRTVTFALVGVGIYLVLFFGLKGYRSLEDRLAEHGALLAKRAELESREELELDKLRQKKRYLLELGLDRELLVDLSSSGPAFERIQVHAKKHEVRLGTQSEASSAPGSGEIARLQIEAVASLKKLSRFLHGLPRLGLPMRVDRASFSNRRDGEGSKVLLNLGLTLFSAPGTGPATGPLAGLPSSALGPGGATP